MDNLVNLGKSFEEVEEDATNTDALEEIYSICAEIMSNNIAKKPITVEYLSDVLDLEDLSIFFNAYIEFVGDLNSVKN
ncbi:MAG: hypothetical protein PHC95_04945 [Parabacteroides sp.]|nr:hypothetical protein [Parabacteroides sp.]